jgi:RHS repeat-associated protein
VQYSSFGEADVQVETVVNNLRFPGQYYDDETGLHYNFQRYYDPKIGRYLRVDPMKFEGGDVNLYTYARHNPLTRIDPFGLKWEISRDGGTKASAIVCDGTVDELAQEIGLDVNQYTEWLSPGPAYRLPSSSTDRITYGEYGIPNTVFAYWAGNFNGLGIGRWFMNWGSSISYLRELGFGVIEHHHIHGSQDDLAPELQGLTQKRLLHGFYFVGHGDEGGLSYVHKWRGPIYVWFSHFSRDELVLDYFAIHPSNGLVDSHVFSYGLALGLVFACESNHGRYPLMHDFPRPGAIWQGYDGLFTVVLEKREDMGPYYDSEAEVPRPYHVQHWIQPGDQGTRID